VNLYDLRVDVAVRFEWYAPDGNLYREYSVNAPSPPEGKEAWNYAVHDSIEVRGKPPSRMLGDWSIKVYVEDAYQVTTRFSIARPRSAISVSLSMESLRQGENLFVSGALSGPHGDVEILLRYEKPDGSAVTRTVRTAADGSFNDTYSPDLSGAWTVTASWDGDEDYEGASMTRSFTVTTAPSWMAAFGGYAVLVAAVAVVVIISFALFWRRRIRRPPIAVKPVAAPSAAKGYCIFCAAPIEPEQEFCMQCGRRQIRIERRR